MKKTYTLGHVRGEEGRKLLKKFDKAAVKDGRTRIEAITYLMCQYIELKRLFKPTRFDELTDVE